MDKRGFKAVAVMVGGTIGAGIFAIPYAVSKIGFIPGSFLLLFLGTINIFINLAYGEVILRTRGDHQMAGYGEIYLGKAGKIAISACYFLGIYGAILAYFIKIGEFSALVFNFDQPWIFSLIFFAFLVVAVSLGLKAISSMDLYLVGLILAFIFSLGIFGFPFLSPRNLIQPLFDSRFLFLPYGVFLFALTGASIIPEVEEVLRKQRDLFKPAIITGSLIPLVVYWLFSLTGVGISGSQTSEDTIQGLLNFLPYWMVSLGAVLGVLTMTTCSISLGYVLRELWHRDFGLNRIVAILLSTVPILCLYLSGIQNFIVVLQITGALSVGLTGTLILLLYHRARKMGTETPAYQINFHPIILWLMGIIFLAGMVSPWIG